MHLSGMIIFPQGGVSGCSALKVNVGPLISRFLFVDNFASKYFYVFYSCNPSPRLLPRSWVRGQTS